MIDRVINLIVTRFNTVRAANKTPTIQTEIVYGKRAVEFNGVTPRVVWTYSNFSVDTTTRIGTNPHQGHDMNFNVMCHCFARSVDELMFLINDVVAATRIALCAPSVKNVSGEILDPGENSQNGIAARLSMSLNMNIWDPGLEYYKIEATNNTANFIDIQPQS